MKNRISGLYAVTPDIEDTATLVGLARAALEGGASVLQYRNKAASYARKREQASELMWLCEAYDVPFIINDHVLLCVELDADGVHMGVSDGELAAARRLLGPGKFIGASCYDRFDLAEQAKAQGADYVAFGACFASGTKPDAAQAPLHLFGEAKRRLALPTVAIGGITVDNAGLAIQAGADAVAVINAVFTADDARKAAREISDLFTQTTS